MYVPSYPFITNIYYPNDYDCRHCRHSKHVPGTATPRPPPILDTKHKELLNNKLHITLLYEAATKLSIAVGVSHIIIV